MSMSRKLQKFHGNTCYEKLPMPTARAGAGPGPRAWEGGHGFHGPTTAAGLACTGLESQSWDFLAGAGYWVHVDIPWDRAHERESVDGTGRDFGIWDRISGHRSRTYSTSLHQKLTNDVAAQLWFAAHDLDGGCPWAPPPTGDTHPLPLWLYVEWRTLTNSGYQLNQRMISKVFTERNKHALSSIFTISCFLCLAPLIQEDVFYIHSQADALSAMLGLHQHQVPRRCWDRHVFLLAKYLKVGLLYHVQAYAWTFYKK